MLEKIDILLPVYDRKQTDRATILHVFNETIHLSYACCTRFKFSVSSVIST